MSSFRLLFLTGLALVSCANPARAIDVSIPAAADTTLNETTPDNNLGGLGQILAGTDGTGRDRRALLLFEVAEAIPAGATVDAATLRIAANDANRHEAFYSLHRLLVGWGEGTGLTSAGQAAAPGDATWNRRVHPGAAWAAPGAAAGVDYVAAASSTTLVDAAGVYVFPGLAADAQGMLDSPATNFGWILISGVEGTAGTGRQFLSQETAAGFRPVLEVSYSVVPEPSTAMLAVAATAAIIAARCKPARISRRRHARATCP